MSKKQRSTAKMDPKELEQQEIIESCEFPASLDTASLKGIHPDEWTNVGPSVVHFSEVMLEKSNDHGKNLQHLQKIIDRFVNYMIRYIKNLDNETFENK